ncbi:hypothetical protein L873DRAFT_1703904 [Choiromyces venosus 120613-1]|uniref:Reverse transcriptase Ty1/copia-type domain-containing protein n=1 Tax=Choiromyces venosus 120613-1 TaxID=1336337 RepID=A0A3N4J8U0_9PEZI|nr:hypothetical protein L873DRAFT_1703904 [Choiromyces venosus 120613-1]
MYTLKRFHARAVVKGFSQISSFNYKEIFAPIIHYEFLYLLLMICAKSKQQP